MKKRIKVLQIHPGYNIKLEDFSDLGEQIIKSLPSDQFETVTAFLQERPNPGEPESRAERSVYFDFTDSQAKGLRLFLMREIFDYCRKEKFDVVVCNRFKPISMFLKLNRWLKIPRCIGIIHGFGSFDRLARRLETRLLIDERWRFVGVSDAVKQYMLGLNCGFNEKNTCYITNAIDSLATRKSQMTRREARAFLGVADDAFVFGSIGRLVPVKGHIHLLNAFARVRDAMPHAKLVIIGEGRSRNDLLSAIKNHGLQDYVLLPGAIPNAQRYAQAFDTFVMPSLEEGLGLAILEAMSAELPVIASDIPAISPVLRSAGGCLVPPGNEAMLAEAMLRHFQYSSEERLQIGQGEFAYLQKHHRIEDYRDQYLKLIRDGVLPVNEVRHG